MDGRGDDMIETFHDVNNSFIKPVRMLLPS